MRASQAAGLLLCVYAMGMGTDAPRPTFALCLDAPPILAHQVLNWFSVAMLGTGERVH